MIQHGARPTKDDSRDNSFRKTFGAVPVDVNAIPDFNLHYGPIPNQNVPNEFFNIPAYPYGCTDYGTCQLGNNKDSRLYNPGYQESITGVNAKGGYDVRASVQTSVDYGLQAQGESAALAKTHRRPALFRVGKNPDYFIGALTAMWLTKRSISCGTPWYPQWSDAATGNKHTYDPKTGSYTVSDGGVKTNIAPVPSGFYNNANDFPWHDWILCGKKTINGVAHLICMPTQGEEFGDGGFLYFPAETINYVMAIGGTCEFTVAEADPDAIQTVGHIFMKNLGFGMHDIEVTELQRNLVYLGYSIPDAITQIYGTETRSAVMAFQRDSGINDDGSHFGPLTRYAMNKALNPSQTLYGAIALFIHTFIGI